MCFNVLALFSYQRLEDIRKYIHRRLDIIRYLVSNHRLDPSKFDYVYIKYSVDLFYDTYYMDLEYDQPGLADLMSDSEDQIGQLDAALLFPSILSYKTPVTSGFGRTQNNIRIVIIALYLLMTHQFQY